VSWLLSVCPSISIEWLKKGGGEGTDELVVFDPETTEEEEEELQTWLLLILLLLLLLEVDEAEEASVFLFLSNQFPSTKV